MSLNYVVLTLDLYDGQGNYPVSGTATFTPSAVLTDAGVEIIGQQPITAVFHAAGPPTVKLLATDNAAPLPAGWTWGVTFAGITGAPAGFSFFLPFSGGASQLLSNLSPVSTGTAFQAYMPLPSGTPTAGQVPVATGSGEGSAWGAGGFSSPMTTLGDLLYENATPAAARLPGNTTAAKNFLTQTGTGSVSAAPAWGTIAAGDVPTLNQNTTGTAAGLSVTLAVGSGGTGSTTRNFAGLLTPTAVKTTTYSAAAGDFVPCDTTSGAFTVTLPNAPADLAVVGLKMVTQGSTNTVTVACAGSDVFNKAGGPTSGTLTLLNQGMLLQYKASGAIWYVVADDLPLSQLDSRYAKLAGATFTGAVAMTPVTLTDAATIAVDASKGNQFKVTLGGNRTLGAPSNPSDGQIITVWFIQDGSGSRTITLALSPGTSGGYWFGTDLTSITLSTAAGTMDKATFQYDATNTRWDVTGFLRGF